MGDRLRDQTAKGEPSHRFYRSEFGRGAVLWLTAPVLVFAAMGLGLLTSADHWIPFQVALMVVAVVQALWIVARTGYRIDGDSLTARILLKRRRVPLCAIKGIRRVARRDPNRSVAEDFALGTNALEIEHARGFLLVSPRDADEFLMALGHAAGAGTGQSSRVGNDPRMS